MTQPAYLALLSTGVCIGVVATSFAAQPPAVDTPLNRSGVRHSSEEGVPAKKCLSDLHTFHNQMLKDGYWLQMPGNGGIGFSAFGAHASAPTSETANLPAGAGFWRARSGNEIRALIAATTILAQHGQQQACETLLTSTRQIYKTYIAELKQRGMDKAAVPEWWHKQIVAAPSVVGINMKIRPDELIGTDVVDAQSNGLGLVDDVALNPKSGMIAYLMIKQGGVFGADENVIPIPWKYFKWSEGAYLLLNTDKANIDAAPKLKADQFFSAHDFDRHSQEVDNYWAGHILK